MKAFFFDRDGTLIVNKHYLSTTTGIKFVECAFAVLYEIQRRGYHIFIITNQSGIKRGYLSRPRVEEIHREILLRLKQEKIEIKEIYYCDHHPNERCSCRKPEGYFLKTAIRRFDIDPSSSFVVGDKQDDILLGRKFGFKTIFLTHDVKQELVPFADFCVTNLCSIFEIL
ncbi:MAG TPA: HAD-IIIA family hydrolase [Candidatus Hydrothermia bacterium]|nr:HAD-IIIA family hydrolase [Candidatus Hydrothermia bacterium]HOL24405.1 HAD-IIIA family hydrolase [Candidatus Hydrothermia bacterium]HPO79407.1 HAD-IIIA family hydrolase [Candidatus Hydrothermia bacterium]